MPDYHGSSDRNIMNKLKSKPADRPNAFEKISGRSIESRGIASQSGEQYEKKRKTNKQRIEAFLRTTQTAYITLCARYDNLGKVIRKFKFSFAFIQSKIKRAQQFLLSIKTFCNSQNASLVRVHRAVKDRLRYMRLFARSSNHF